MGCCQRYGYLVPLIFGCIFFFGSIGFDFLISMGINQELSKRLVLTNDTDFYKNWEAPKLPMYSKIHLFNVRNAADFMNGKAAADLEQVGPFTFQKKLVRKIYGFSENDTQITFRTTTYFYFVPELSNMTAFDQNITMLNLPLAGMLGAAIQSTRNSLKWVFAQSMLANSIKQQNQKLLITLTPREFLIDGYNNTMIAAMKQLGGMAGENDDPSGKFSLMMARNGSNRGLWTSYTGKDSMSKTGAIKTWNELTEFSCWSGKSCNQIKGVEGAFFPPPISSSTVLTVFAPELNGTMTAHFREEVHESGLLKYRFNLMEDALQAPNEHPDNECWCVKSKPADKLKYCQLDGIVDISACKQGAPIMMSKPHFYLGSPILRSKLQGLNPERGLHESFFDVDPNLGVVTRALVRMQTNVDLTLLKELRTYKRLPAIIFPCFISEDTVKVEGEFLEPIAEFQSIKYRINLSLKIVMILGAAFISIAILVWFKTWKSRQHVFRQKTAKLPAGHEEEEDAARISFLPPEKVEMNGNGIDKNGLESETSTATTAIPDLQSNGRQTTTTNNNNSINNNNISGP